MKKGGASFPFLCYKVKIKLRMPMQSQDKKIHLYAIAADKFFNHSYSAINALALGIGKGERHKMLVFSGLPSKNLQEDMLLEAGLKDGQVVTALAPIPNSKPYDSLTCEVYVSAVNGVDDMNVNAAFPNAQVHVMSSVDELSRRFSELKDYTKAYAQGAGSAVGASR
jgi:hypothetical protein